MLIVTINIKWWHLRVPVSQDSVTVSQRGRHQITWRKFQENHQETGPYNKLSSKMYRKQITAPELVRNVNLLMSGGLLSLWCWGRQYFILATALVGKYYYNFIIFWLFDFSLCELDLYQLIQSSQMFSQDRITSNKAARHKSLRVDFLLMIYFSTPHHQLLFSK